MVRESSLSFSGLEIRGKRRTGWRKARFIILPSLNLQPQSSKMYKKVAREGKRGIKCWWNGLKDQKIKWEDAQPSSDGRGGSGGLRCVQGEQRRRQDGWQRGKSDKEDVPHGFHGSLFQGRETEDEFQQSGKAAGILQVGTCCQRNVLQLCCSRYCSLTNHNFIPWPTASTLKNTFPISS